MKHARCGLWCLLDLLLIAGAWILGLGVWIFVSRGVAVPLALLAAYYTVTAWRFHGR